MFLAEHFGEVKEALFDCLGDFILLLSFFNFFWIHIVRLKSKLGLMERRAVNLLVLALDLANQ